MKIKAFLLFLVNKILNSVIGGGLFCGFMTTATVGLGYFFVVTSFFQYKRQIFIKDNQRRVAAMTGFVTGQFVMFTSIYNRPLHEGLVQPHSIIMLFLGSFFVQLFWTSRKTLRNRRFLDPHDLITKRRYVLRLQLEFIMNFFVQLCNPYLEPDSMIPRLVNFCLSSYTNDNEKKILFVRSSFAGWLIGHIFFMILFMKLLEFIVIIMIWVRKNFFES
jgi:hypothetical protein